VADAPAVVLYMSYLGLGLVRALGREGVRVFALDPHPDALGMNSRYCTPVVTPDLVVGGASAPRVFSYSPRGTEPPPTAPLARPGGAGYLEFLLEFGRRLPGKAVLYPTGDPTVLFLSREREALSRYYHFVMPEHATVLRLLTKDGLASIAREHDIPAPRTVIPANRAEAEGAAGQLEFPVLLKPAESHDWKSPEIVRLIGVGTKVIQCGTPEELLARYDALCGCGVRSAECGVKPGVIVQEMIPGEDDRLAYFCFYIGREGELLGAFAGRKCRVLPPGLGSASMAESMADPALSEAALRLLRAVNYRGLGGVEFKLDPRDNAWKLIEVNVRFGLWDSLGARCGVNLAHIAYRDALGERVEPRLRCRTGVKWVCVQRDLSAFRLYRGQGKLTTWRWLRSLAGEKMWAVLAWDDLAPFLSSAPAYLWGLVVNRIAKAKGKRQKAKGRNGPGEAR